MILKFPYSLNDYLLNQTVPHSIIVAFEVGFPESVPKACNIYITSFPSRTLPKTVCFPFNQGQGTKVMKN